MADPNIRIPSIHMNGSEGAALEARAIEAVNHGRAFLKALEDMAPNARDYYPQGEDAFAEADAQQRSRCTAVKLALQEVEKIYIAIEQQMRDRSHRA